MSTTRSQTLGEVAFLNLRAAGYGTTRAMKGAADAIATAGALAIAATHSENGFPTQAEYARYWKQSERSAQREWERFRKAFPDEEGPERLAKVLMTGYSRRLREREDPSIAFSLPASVLTAS
jgi:hypothetical protein